METKHETHALLPTSIALILKCSPKFGDSRKVSNSRPASGGAARGLGVHKEDTIMLTKERIAYAVKATAAISEAIRAVGEIPSGHLYAQVCGVITMGDYESIIALLKRAELVSETGHVLRWVGPVIAEGGRS
jgi:hypothetical protein